MALMETKIIMIMFLNSFEFSRTERDLRLKVRFLY